MKITFIKDCPAIIASGNSAYIKGTKADLRKGQELIDAGYAREGWEVGNLANLANELYELLDYDNLSLIVLREMAKEQNIKNAGRMKRKTLIKRLTNVD